MTEQERIGAIDQATARRLYQDAITGLGCTAFANICRLRTPAEGKCFTARVYFGDQIGPIVNDAIASETSETKFRPSTLTDIQHGFSLLERLVIEASTGNCEHLDEVQNAATYWEGALSERLAQFIDPDLPQAGKQAESAACALCVGGVCQGLIRFEAAIENGIGDHHTQPHTPAEAYYDLEKLQIQLEMQGCLQAGTFDIKAAVKRMPKRVIESTEPTVHDMHNQYITATAAGRHKGD